MHIKYPKIKSLGHEDTDGILIGTVTIEEKIDGANASIWIEDGDVKCGSRTRILGEESFNGFVEYVKKNKQIGGYLRKNPNLRLYGEWLVRHTISYNELAYKKFYLFDVMVIPDELEAPKEHEGTKREVQDLMSREVTRQCKWLDADQVRIAADAMGLATPSILGCVINPSPDEIKKYAGQSELGEKGEGVVVKNKDFINKWGDRVCAKVVTQEFMEGNAIVFGGNNKHSETYAEMKMVNACMTVARIKKIMHKLQPQINEKLDMQHTARIIQAAYHDMFEEELWDFAKKQSIINFKHLQNLSCKKAARIYHDILNGHDSVAYNPVKS